MGFEKFKFGKTCACGVAVYKGKGVWKPADRQKAIEQMQHGIFSCTPIAKPPIKVALKTLFTTSYFSPKVVILDFEYVSETGLKKLLRSKREPRIIVIVDDGHA